MRAGGRAHHHSNLTTAPAPDAVCGCGGQRLASPGSGFAFLHRREWARHCLQHIHCSTDAQASQWQGPDDAQLELGRQQQQQQQQHQQSQRKQPEWEQQPEQQPRQHARRYARMGLFCPEQR